MKRREQKLDINASIVPEQKLDKEMETEIQWCPDIVF